MDIRAMKHAAKLAEWGEKVKACRSSGLPVRTWCQQHDISTQTYYTWEHEYLEETNKQTLNSRQVTAQGGQIVRVDPRKLPDEVQFVVPESAIPQETTKVEITLRYGEMSVEIPAGIEITQIAALMKALRQTC